MTDQLPIPCDILAISIKVDGSEIDSAFELQSASLSLDGDRPQSLVLTFALGAPEAGELLERYSQHFRADSEIAVTMGYGRDTARLFRGKIANRRVQLDENGLEFLVEAAGQEGEPPAAPVTIEVRHGVHVLAANLSHPQGDQMLLLPGHQTLVPGITIALAGFGRPWDGDRAIASARHEVSAGQWTCEVKLAG